MSASRRFIASSAIATLAVVAGMASPASGAKERLTAVGVRNGDTELSFVLSRTRVNPGPARIQYTNTGEDPHDVKIKKRGRRGKLYSIGTLEDGGVDLVIIPNLRRGATYRIWCSLSDHRDQGMEAKLTVRKRVKR